jgi:hypothetical protein
MRHINTIAILSASLLSASFAIASDNNAALNLSISDIDLAERPALIPVGICGGGIEVAPDTKGKTNDASLSLANVASPSESPNPLPGNPTKGNPFDLTGDGLVDGADLVVLMSQWGSCAPWGNGLTVCSADFTGDGIIAHEDLNLLLRYWTHPSAAR